MKRATGIRRYFREGFLADVLKLSFGALAGRLIALATLPILTRIYTPEDFAVLATYLAVLGTIAVAACLRMDVAVPMAETDEDAVNLLALALVSLATVALVALILVLTIPGQLAQWLGNPAIEPHLWLVPLGIGLAGTYSAFQFWTTRARRFGHIARTRVTQSFLGAATMLSLGWWGLTPFGLLLGNAFSIGAGGIGLAAGAVRNERRLFDLVSPANMRAALRRHRRYPMFSTPEALLNIAGVQVPVLIIAAQAGTEAGFLLLAMQLMTAPMSLLGSSISQVYVSRAPVAFRTGELAELTFSIMRRLALLGIGPLILVGVIAPIVVPYIFGPEWERSGEIIFMMVPWIVLQFIVSPVSMIMYVVGRQRAMLAMTAAGIVLRVGAVLLAMQFEIGSPVLGLVAGSFAYYLTVTGFVLVATGTAPRRWLPLFGTLLNWRVLLPAIFAVILHSAI